MEKTGRHLCDDGRLGLCSDTAVSVRHGEQRPTRGIPRGHLRTTWLIMTRAAMAVVAAGFVAALAEPFVLRGRAFHPWRPPPKAGARGSFWSTRGTGPCLCRVCCGRRPRFRNFWPFMMVCDVSP